MKALEQIYMGDFVIKEADGVRRATADDIQIGRDKISAALNNANANAGDDVALAGHDTIFQLQDDAPVQYAPKSWGDLDELC